MTKLYLHYIMRFLTSQVMKKYFVFQCSTWNIESERLSEKEIRDVPRGTSRIFTMDFS